jgi:hypothetical protein
MTPSLSELATSSAESTSSSSGSFDDDARYEPFDLSDATYVKQHPTTAVGGDIAVLRYIPDDPNEDLWGQGDFVAILDDPFVVTDEADFESTAIFRGEDTSDDYKVVNTDDDATEIEDGVGVIFDGRLYRSQPVDAFDEDRIALKLTGNAGRSAARALDINGLEELRAETTENGAVETNGALVENPPDDVDEKPRVARYSELRPDMDGETVVFQLRRGSDVHDDPSINSYWSTVAVETDDGFDIVDRTNEFDATGESPEDNVMTSEYVEWHWPDDAGSTSNDGESESGN